MEEDEIIKELNNKKYPKPMTVEGTKKILEQMEKSICKIFKKDGSKGTGFFCKINYENKDIPVMMTNNHVIDNKYLNKNEEIEITLNDDKENKTIQLKNRIIYTNEDYDITIIEIKEKDEINDYMNIDKKYLNTNKDKIYDNSIYIIQYPSGEKAAVSYGIINHINEYNIEYFCNTDTGSSGSPIINILNNEIIGIHKEGLKKREINRGTLLKYPIKDFINNIKLKNNNINEIEIEMKVKKEEINKDIYFLDNTDYEDENKIKHYHDNLKELNEFNTELYINNEKCPFKKYFKPKNDEIYKIKLKFKDIKDCSFMFAGCENIININFINFNTKNVKDMKYMFSGCINLEELDLSKFNTKNVTNMEGMFGQYDNLSYLDLKSILLINKFDELNEFKNKIKVYYKGCIQLKSLILPSSFNTQNVINMMGMFCGCNNLKILDFPSSFNTQSVTNMMYMFYNCKKLEKLILPSSFNTQKVTNMMNMFAGCNNLKVLNLPFSFDTQNVTNMMEMFTNCIKLETLELPNSFNTENTINMMLMFAGNIELKKLILPATFNTRNVTNMYGMFRNCAKLKNLELPSKFNTEKTINMEGMFYNCIYFENFNLSSFTSSDKKIAFKSPY